MFCIRSVEVMEVVLSGGVIWSVMLLRALSGTCKYGVLSDIQLEVE